MAINASSASAVTEQHATVRAISSEELSLTLDTRNVVFENDRTGRLMTEHITVTGSTNYKWGYHISFSIYGEHNNLQHIFDDNSYIPSITSSASEATFPSLGWGFSTNHGAIFNQIPMDATEIFATGVAGTYSHDFILGMKVADEVSSGRYENDLVFTIVSDSSYHGADSITYMQEMDSYICSASPENEQYQLIDKRDGKRYWIAKLRDNNCWMTQNLDLDLSSSITLTPDDTDITYNWTPKNSTIKKVTSESQWVENMYEPISMDLGNHYYSDRSDDEHYGYCEDLFNNCPNFSSTPFPKNGTHGHYGNYYNWTAAIARNDTTDMPFNYTNNSESYRVEESSICPKGWELTEKLHNGFTDGKKAIETMLSIYSYDEISPFYPPYGGLSAFQDVSVPKNHRRVDSRFVRCVAK